jgi:hypothetical protein
VVGENPHPEYAGNIPQKISHVPDCFVVVSGNIRDAHLDFSAFPADVPDVFQDQTIGASRAANVFLFRDLLDVIQRNIGSGENEVTPKS